MIRLSDLSDDDRITVMLAYEKVICEKLAAERGPRRRCAVGARHRPDARWMGRLQGRRDLEDGKGPLTLN